MSIFDNSENIFLNIINKYDIFLDDDYLKLKEKYNTRAYDTEYNKYFNLFSKYYYLKNDINIIYYIVILFYIDRNLLTNFIRFYTSKLLNYKEFNIKNDKIINYDNLINLNKIQLIDYLKEIIDYNYNNFLFFILCFQIYF
tara:strand:+ start:10344 stop:10766 length:423 start_codon:yes stop_codon:yes gene_type:complete